MLYFLAWFQSTPSLRRATEESSIIDTDVVVSIHALLAESDGSVPLYKLAALVFQSTPSLRRATESSGKRGCERAVSIHALLAESDLCMVALTTSFSMFQSTPSLRRATAPTVHVVNQSCKRGFAPTSRRRYITYRLLFIILGCQSAFSNVLQESPTSRQFDVSLGLAQRPCQTALK